MSHDEQHKYSKVAQHQNRTVCRDHVAMIGRTDIGFMRPTLENFAIGITFPERDGLRSQRPHASENPHCHLKALLAENGTPNVGSVDGSQNHDWRHNKLAALSLAVRSAPGARKFLLRATQRTQLLPCNAPTENFLDIWATPRNRVLALVS